MAKLKNYEIDALYNVVCKKLQALKEEKLVEFKKGIKLTKDEIKLLAVIDEYNKLREKEKEILALGNSLYKKVFETDHGYNWMLTTKDGILNRKAEEFLPEKLKAFSMNQWPYNSTIKDRIIIANIDGNVEELVENIIAEYND